MFVIVIVSVLLLCQNGMAKNIPVQNCQNMKGFCTSICQGCYDACYDGTKEMSELKFCLEQRLICDTKCVEESERKLLKSIKRHKHIFSN